MFTRALISFLASVYFVVAVGITISGHYCGGYLESYSFNVVADEHMCCGGMPMDNNCCEDIQVTIKSSEDHFVSEVVKIECPPTFIPVQTFSSELFTQGLQEVIIAPVVPPPPLLVNCPVHIRHRAILI